MTVLQQIYKNIQMKLTDSNGMSEELIKNGEMMMEGDFCMSLTKHVF